MLVDAGLIERQQLDKALKVQAQKGGKLVQILIAMGFFHPHAFVQFLARQPGVASLNLSNYEVPRELVALVPREFALKHEVFPIDRLGKLLTVGMVCPLDAATIGELERFSGLRVKPILCSAQDIRQAIQRYYPPEGILGVAEGTSGAGPVPLPLQRLETSLRLRNVVALIRGIEGLPTLPETVARVRQAMAEPGSSIEDVAQIVNTDPPLAARVLRVANSAAYGFPHRIDNLRLAVSLLGLRETYSIVLSAAIIERYNESPLFDYKRFWAHSMKCAAAALVVAEACGQSRRSSLSAAGLLHDLGRIALLEVVPDVFVRLDPNLSGESLVAAEEAALGITHAEAGYELASLWSLPDEIAQAIRFHHAPERATDCREVVAIVAAGDALARRVARKSDPDPEQTDELERRLALLDIDAGMTDELMRRFEEQQAAAARTGRSE